MKLRRLFPAAALCLSVGIASAVAEEPADEDSRRELIYSFGETTAAAKEDNTMAKALLQFAGASDPENGWPDSVSYLNDDSAEPDDELRRVYEFAVPFDESTTDQIGTVGFLDDDNNPIFSGGAVAAAGADVSDKTSYSILYFEKKAYRNAPNTIKILSERSLAEDPDQEAEEEPLIALLSAPFSLLVLIIGLSFFAVTYTSRTKD